MVEQFSAFPLSGPLDLDCGCQSSVSHDGLLESLSVLASGVTFSRYQNSYRVTVSHTYTEHEAVILFPMLASSIGDLS
jgi:hypothetical protein